MSDIEDKLAALKAKVRKEQGLPAQESQNSPSPQAQEDAPVRHRTKSKPSKHTRHKSVAAAQAPSKKPIKAMPLSARQISLSFGSNKILHGINVHCAAGEISTILGPSGSGKSTLLKCMASLYNPDQGFVTAGKLDLTKNKTAYREILGYVPQDDIIHTELKVHQAFYYAAKLRLSNTVDDNKINRRIDTITNALGLNERKNLRIAKLSGGQRKRVNIGIELLADPQVLILDEPASGLDPGTEEDLLGLLRQLANEGRTIILTTHSMEFPNLVDRIIMLMEGRLIFTGTSDALLQHFDIPHVADVFKAIRQHDASQWQRAFKG